jgi:lactate dehydrogenase-like 2-hydroxyacid dehydrogenase
MLKSSEIAISSTPIAVDDATADIAIFLMLGALRQVTIPMTAIRDGKFRGKTPIGHDPNKKTLGILGMGGIGRVRCTSIRSAVPFFLPMIGTGKASSGLWHDHCISQSFTTTF